MVSQAMSPHGAAGRVFAALMRMINAPAYARALQLLTPGPKEAVLEIGFGTGDLVRRLAARAAFVGGVDPSALMLETARRRNAGAIGEGRVDLRLGEAGHLPWPSGRFDAVCALHCFQFWADPAAALAEIERAIRPGGRLLLILRDHQGPAKRRAWLPNPLSRSGAEVDAALELLRERGWRRIERREDVGSSVTIHATWGD